MPQGDLVESQLARNTPQHRPPSWLLPVVLVFMFTLLGVVQLRYTLFSFFTGFGNSMLRSVLYGIFGLLLFLLLRGILYLIDLAICRASVQNRAGEHPSKTVEQFMEDAARLHIAPGIAREAFQLFVSLVPDRTAIDLNDDLRSQLRLSDQQIGSLLAALPELCDRSKTQADIPSILSVYDLLHHIECAPAWKPGPFDSRSGSPAPVISAVPVSPLADLKNASPRDSRFRTRAHFSGLKRRAGDYSGPYRRATDRRPDPNYAGPRRRVSDIQSSDGQTPRLPLSGQRDAERRVLDRRSSTHQIAELREAVNEGRQHKAVPTDTSLLDAPLDLPRGSKSCGLESAVHSGPVSCENSTAPEPSLHRS